MGDQQNQARQIRALERIAAALEKLAEQGIARTEVEMESSVLATAWSTGFREGKQYRDETMTAAQNPYVDEE